MHRASEPARNRGAIMQANLSAIPPRLHALAGEIIDADGHEYTPVLHWAEQFGSVTRDFADAVGGGNFPLAEPVEVDATEINSQTVWKTKLVRAPGAFDMKRRLEVM